MSSLQLLSLGGSGNVTQNMYVYQYEDEVLLVDCGIGFPDQYMPGVDVLIPDIAYIQKLLEEGKHIVGMILTHGHDDHIGATPYVFPHLPQFPVYGSPLTLGFTKERLSEAPTLPEFRVVKERTPFQISAHFSAQAFHVTHSVPDDMHYAITTPVGVIYHGTDFKLDETPVDHKPTDLEGIGQMAQSGVKLMLLDCLRVEQATKVPSESTVGPVIARLMGETQGKFVVTLMSSHIHRIQQVADAAKHHGRKLVFVGRSVEQNVRVARELNLLHIAEDMLVDKRDSDSIPDNKVCMIVAGSQGQEGSSLVRAIFGEHPVLQIKPTDTVVFSADAIPGNELNYYAAIDELCSNGVHVLYPSVEPGLHQSGHASKVEQQEMVTLVKPEYVLPIGGADRHRVKFAELVTEPLGFPAKNVLLPKSGQVLGISSDQIKVVEEIVLKPVAVDGLGVGDVGPQVLSDRRSMGQSGMIVVVIPTRSGEADLHDMQVVSRGFVFMKDAQEVIDFIKQTVASVIAESKGAKQEEIRKTIEKRMSRKLFKIIRREPLITIVFVPVG